MRTKENIWKHWIFCNFRLQLPMSFGSVQTTFELRLFIRTLSQTVLKTNLVKIIELSNFSMRNKLCDDLNIHFMWVNDKKNKTKYIEEIVIVLYLESKLCCSLTYENNFWTYYWHCIINIQKVRKLKFSKIIHMKISNISN